MIPKKIHYVWFGNNEMSPLARTCLASWERHCPDYEIIRWDESNFDIESNAYCKEAYEAGKWAFASDYARLSILVNHGGIYMDTDVELLSSLNPFLFEEAFSGFEAIDRVPTGLMAAERNQSLFVSLLADYNDRHFVLSDGSFDTRTNVEVITETCLNRGLLLNGHKQTIEGFTLYPPDYFCPKSGKTLEVSLTKNSVAIHHFDGSWLSPSTRDVKLIKEQISNNHPGIPSVMRGRIANVKYVIDSKDFKHPIRLLKSKSYRYYHE